MKEATGELNMTVVTVVAIAAVVALFYAFQGSLNLNTCKNICPNGEAQSYEKAENGDGGTCTCSASCSITVDGNGDIQGTSGTGC